MNDTEHLAALAMRHAPTFRGEREAGRLWLKLVRYQEHTGRRPCGLAARRLARQVLIDVVRESTKRRHFRDGRVVGLGRHVSEFVSFDEPVTPEGSMTWADAIPDATSRQPWDGETFPWAACLQHLDILRPREREIVVACVLGDEPQVSVARRLDLTESRISQIVTRSLRRMRQHLERWAPSLTPDKWPDRRPNAPRRRAA